MANINIQRNRLRRLRILQILYNQRPELLSEGLIYQQLKQDPDLQPSLDGVRRSLDYLHGRRFAEVKKGKAWTAKILPDGVDYLEGDDPAISGISHPDEFIS